jgi:hypothetical protein
MNNKKLLIDLLTNVYNNVLRNLKDENEINEILNVLSPFGDADFLEMKEGLKNEKGL